MILAMTSLTVGSLMFAEKSRVAGIPAASVCMNCHRFVSSTLDANRLEETAALEEGRSVRPVVSPELQRLYGALALDDRMQSVADQSPTPIAWAKVHDLPDFVYFDHRAHVTADVSCQQCHGPVENMERVRQVEKNIIKKMREFFKREIPDFASYSDESITE